MSLGNTITKRIIIPLVITLFAVIAILAVYNWCIKPSVGKSAQEPTETAISAKNTSENQASEEWRTIFADFFKDIEKNKKYKSSSDYMSAYIVDLDGDNIPEVVGNWYGSWNPIMAYYDNGVIKETEIPLDYWIHSTAYAGEYPNKLYFDTQKNIVIVRSEGRNYGTMFNKTAVAYKYNHGKFEEYKNVSFDAPQEDFSNYEHKEQYNAVKKHFEEQFKEFSKEFTLIDFSDVAVYDESVPVYISKYFYNSAEIGESDNQTENKSSKIYYEAYAAEMENRYGEASNYTAFDYAIIDLDHEGIPELLIRYGPRYAEEKTDIYRYNTGIGKCSLIDTIDGRGILYSEPTGNVFYNDVAFHGHARIYKCILERTYVTEILLFQVAYMEEYEGKYGEYKPDYDEPYKEGNIKIEFEEIKEETPNAIRALNQ